MGLSTGRFENEDDKPKEQFSKSANHAKVLRIINAERLVPIQDPNAPVSISKQGSLSGVANENTTNPDISK